MHHTETNIHNGIFDTILASDVSAFFRIDDWSQCPSIPRLTVSCFHLNAIETGDQCENPGGPFPGIILTREIIIDPQNQ